MAQKNVANKVLSLLNCSTSSSETEHLCENPLMLSCGNYICKTCLKAGVNHTSIKCNICGETNKRELSQNDNPQAFNLLVEQNIDLLFNVTLEKFKNTFDTCKNMIYNCEERIDTHVQFVKESIWIRIESVKVELDNLYQKFSDELDEIKEKWKTESKDIKFEKFDMRPFESELNKLEKEINENVNLNKENLYNYQKQMKKIQEIISEYKKSTPSLEFKESEEKLSKELIGKLLFNIGDVDRMIIDRIKINKFEQVAVQYQPWDICQLSNGNLLLSNFNNSNLQLCDPNIQPINTIGSINNATYQIIGITNDENDNIYMCVYSAQYVIKTDLSFNQLARFGTGTAGTTQNQVYYPAGICYYNQCVFLCDFQNKRVIKLNSNLAFQSSYQLNYYPWYIKNINNIAIVRPNNNEPSIYFYDLNTFNMLKKYEGHNGMIGISGNYFYEYYPNNKTFYCYNTNGELVEQIQTNGQKLATANSWGSLCVMKEKLLLTNYSTNLITII